MDRQPCHQGIERHVRINHRPVDIPYSLKTPLASIQPECSEENQGGTRWLSLPGGVRTIPRLFDSHHATRHPLIVIEWLRSMRSRWFVVSLFLVTGYQFS